MPVSCAVIAWVVGMFDYAELTDAKLSVSESGALASEQRILRRPCAVVKMLPESFSWNFVFVLTYQSQSQLIAS